MKKKILLLLILLPSFILFAQPIKSEASELPPGMVIGDEQGIHADKDGEYFVNVTDVMPGMSWHKNITLLNMEKDVPYQLTMLISPPEVSGKLDLSEAIQMKLTYEGKVVYEGPSSGVNKEKSLQKTPLDLGTFKAGDSRSLEVDYSISGKYTNRDFEVKNKMQNVWTFYAVKTTTPVKPVDPGKKDPISLIKSIGKLPMTGETMKQVMIILCLGMLIVLIVLLIWKKKSNGHLTKNKGKEGSI